MEYKYEEKRRPRNWSCQCAVRLDLNMGAVSGSDRGWGRVRRIIPGKKRAVFGRDVAVMEPHLVQLALHNGTVILCRGQKALHRRWEHQSPCLPQRKVWVSCFIL